MSARVLWPQAPLKQWRARLRFFFMQSLAGMRIAELLAGIIARKHNLRGLVES